MGSLGFGDANCYIWDRWAMVPYCTAQGTVCNRVTLVYNRNWRNIINQLCFNKKINKKEKEYLYVWLDHFTVQQKLTQHCKLTYFNFLNFINKEVLRKKNSTSYIHQRRVYIYIYIVINIWVYEDFIGIIVHILKYLWHFINWRGRVQKFPSNTPKRIYHFVKILWLFYTL